MHMDFNIFFTLLSFFIAFLCAYLGDLIFSLPNGVVIPFRSKQVSLKPITILPWFSFNFPTFIGIILSGTLIKNQFPYLISHLDDEIINIIRIISTITIIYRIALGLDLSTLKAHKTTIFAISFLPNICEALYVTYTSRIFFDIKEKFSFCLGFEVSGASTAILMPALLAFKEEKLGFVPSILLAASVLDNIFSIFAFNVARTVVLAVEGETIDVIITKRMEGLLLGVLIGVLLGVIYKIIYIKVKWMGLQFILSYFIGILLVFWLDEYGFRGAGFLIIWISTLISTNNEKKIQDFSNKTWSFLRLYLFFFIGISVDFRNLSLNLLKNAFLLILSSSFIRVFITFLCLSFLEKFSKCEILFGSMTWLAKASLQAALGSAMLYESITRHYEKEVINQALIISQISICYIMFTGPIGAILINKYGRKLLEVNKEVKNHADEEKIRLIHE